MTDLGHVITALYVGYRDVYQSGKISLKDEEYINNIISRIEFDKTTGIRRLSPTWYEFSIYYKLSAFVLADTLLYSKDIRIRNWGPSAFLDPEVVRFVIAYTYDWVKLFFDKTFSKSYQVITGIEFHKDWDKLTAINACMMNSAVYEHLVPEWQNDDDVISAAIDGHYAKFTFDHEGSVVQPNMFEIFKKNPFILCQIPDYKQVRFTEQAVRANGMALGCVDQRRFDEAHYDVICNIAFKNDMRSLQFIEFQLIELQRDQVYRNRVFEESLDRKTDILQEHWFRSLCESDEFTDYKQRQKEKEDTVAQLESDMSGR